MADERQKAVDGGAAFPFVLNDAYCSGMRLRDWMAGQALAGLLAFSRGGEGETIQYSPADAAEHAYSMADAMLAEREKHKPK